MANASDTEPAGRAERLFDLALLALAQHPFGELRHALDQAADALSEPLEVPGPGKGAVPSSGVLVEQRAEIDRLLAALVPRE